MKTSKKNSKRRSRKLKKVAKRLAAYSAAAAATVLTTGSMANAAEQIWDIPDTLLVGNGTFFNLTNGSFGDATTVKNNSTQGVFRVGSFYSPGNPAMYGPAYSTFAGIVGPGGLGPFSKSADVLSVSSSVGPGNSFAGNTSFPSYGNYAFLGDFTGDPDPGVVGLRFKLGEATHYGWAMVTGPGGGMSLIGFGYNDTPDAASHPPPVVGDLNGDRVVDEADKDIFKLWHLADLDPNDVFDEDVAASRGDLSDPIDFQNNIEDFILFKSQFEFFKSIASLEVTNVGALRASESSSASVPEPSSVLLLALGATGLGIWRRRKQV